MRLAVRRAFVLAGSALALLGGARAFEAQAGEPPPVTPLAGASRLTGTLRAEQRTEGALSRALAAQATASLKLTLETQTLTAELASTRSTITHFGASGTSTTVSGASTQVQSVTGASGSGEGGDGGGGDD